MTSNQRTIIVVNDFGHVNGGAAQVALASAAELAYGGHRVLYFCAVAPVAPLLAEAGIEVICLDQQEIARDPDRLRAAIHGIWNRDAGVAFERVLARFDPAATIVHIHGWSKVLSSSVVRAATVRSFPTVVTLHDFFVACPNGGFYDFSMGEICSRRALGADCLSTNCDVRKPVHKAYRVLRQWIQDGPGGMRREVRHFIYHSVLTRRLLEPYLPASAQLHYVSCPIAAEKAEAVAVGDNAKFILVGRMAQEKGCTLFAEATRAAGLAATCVGDGPMRQAVQAINPAVEITGWQDRAGVNRWLGQARALVFPSVWYETLGMTVAEAAARGVPAVVSDTSAAVEMIEDGCTGLLFKGGDAADLAVKIQQLRDPELAARMGRAAYDKFWQTPPTAARHAAGLLDVYARMLEEPR